MQEGGVIYGHNFILELFDSLAEESSNTNIYTVCNS